MSGTPKVLVSACLLGQTVRYDGRAMAFASELLAGWRERGLVVALCPEISAGFPVPRRPAEIESGATGREVDAGKARIFDDAGADVTDGFRLAARHAVEAAEAHGCRYALLTDGSPSCGATFIYSGRHDGARKPGQGVVAAALRGRGVEVFAQHEIRELAAKMAASAR